VRAIQVTAFGGPEALIPTELPDPEPAAGQLLLTVSRAGINYADTHAAENSYLSAHSLPFVPGAEVVGHTADGRRVVALTDGGGYAEKALARPELTFDVPEGVSDGAALALVLQGTTAWLMLRRSAHLEPGESVVVHAAAGGVGTLAVQLAKTFGAGRVIATASSPDKRQLALDLGADAAVDPTADDLTAALREANGGPRVDVVLEMTGGRVTDQSIAALAPFGRLVFFGMASRQPPSPVSPVQLMARSTAVIGFWLMHAVARPGVMAEAMRDLLARTAAGELHPVVGGDYPLSEARRAHEDIRSRRTTGKLVLDPAQ
jgi:NADPH2:quinone reductase